MTPSTDQPGERAARTLDRVARALPGGGETRPGQLEMARLVAEAIASDRHLVVQAGTGTGKSLAYLVPAVTSGRPVVVATATKALQDQLATKDLPFLERRLGPDSGLTFSVLKGRSNYLCRQRVFETTRGADPARLFEDGTDGPSQPGGARRERDRRDSFAGQVRRILEWSERTPTGDRAHLDFEPDARVWASLSVGPRECPGAFRCPSGSSCFAERARALAGASDVVVVNTSLYATHVASDGAVLPPHDVVVFDEAHAVEDVMSAALGVELSPGRIRALSSTSKSLLGPDDGALADELIEVADSLDGVLRGFAGRRVLRHAHRPRDGARDGECPERAGPLGQGPGDDELVRVLELARSRVERLTAALRRAEREAPDETGHARTALAAGSLTEDLGAVLTGGEEQVAWVDDASTRSISLRTAPVDVGALLSARLWPHVTAVLTSATIPPNVEGRVGLPRERTDRADVGSPFPYGQCALLYCPTNVPDRRDERSEQAVHEELRRLMLAGGGRTLALFTSWRAMHAAVKALRPVLPFELLAQNELPKPKLLELFEENDSTCLFATMSFWQGVDVPGPSLSLVVIDRIPFPRPDDPLVEARRERAAQGAFNTVDLPRAATLLAQGAGRLVRSSTDSGVVAVLDRRLATASYANVLRRALPPMRFTTRREEALTFLDSIARARPVASSQ